MVALRVKTALVCAGEPTLARGSLESISASWGEIVALLRAYEVGLAAVLGGGRGTASPVVCAQPGSSRLASLWVIHWCSGVEARA